MLRIRDILDVDRLIDPEAAADGLGPANNIEEEIHQRLQMNPMNFQSAETFMKMVMDVEHNKVHEVQLRQINQVDKINKMNAKRMPADKPEVKLSPED